MLGADMGSGGGSGERAAVGEVESAVHGGGGGGRGDAARAGGRDREHGHGGGGRERRAADGGGGGGRAAAGAEDHELCELVGAEQGQLPGASLPPPFSPPPRCWLLAAGRLAEAEGG
eukprot:2374660-Rhodomonas_salina.1